MKNKYSGRPYKITKKDNNLFFTSLMAGLAGGVIGNFFVTSFYDVSAGMLSFSYRLLLFFLSGCAFLGIILWFNTKIIKNLNSSK